MRINYKEYKLEDFIADEQFKHWVLNHHTNDRLDVFWQNWMNSNPGKRETVLLARELIQAMEFNISQSLPEEKDHVLNKILNGERSDLYTSSSGKYRVDRKFLPSYWVARVAAILILAFGLYFLYSTFSDQSDPSGTPIMITKRTSGGEKFAPLVLPDGSRVYLNSESSITYPESFSDSIREIRFSGEGFFEVVRNEKKPFIVRTGDISTYVLGTSFNINSYKTNNELSISLVTGQVKVFRLENQNSDQRYSPEVVLSPGEKVSIENGSMDMKVSHFDSESEIAWKDGVLIFKNATQQELFDRLERWYGVRIRLQNQPDIQWHVSGRFSNLSLEKVLENLNYTHKIAFKINRKEVLIKFLK